MVPGPIAPLAQGGIHQMTAALAGKNRPMYLVQGPAPGHLGAKFGDHRSAVRARAQVHPLIGIGRQVVEPVRICCRVHELVAATANHHDRCNRALGEIFPDHLPGPAPPWSAGSRLRPSIGAAYSIASPSLARSISVGRISSSDDGSDTRCGTNRSGACTISGMRQAFSKKFILYQRPRSPSMSPWSASTMITVFASSCAWRSVATSEPI